MTLMERPTVLISQKLVENNIAHQTGALFIVANGNEGC